MLISYNSIQLQEVCFQSATAVKYLGREAAISLQDRHADIQAAQSIYELPIGNLSVEGNHCSLVVSDMLKIEMIPNHGPVNDGEIFDWSTVSRVKIVRINDVE